MSGEYQIVQGLEVGEFSHQKHDDDVRRAHRRTRRRQELSSSDPRGQPAAHSLHATIVAPTLPRNGRAGATGSSARRAIRLRQARVTASR